MQSIGPVSAQLRGLGGHHQRCPYRWKTDGDETNHHKSGFTWEGPRVKTGDDRVLSRNLRVRCDAAFIGRFKFTDGVKG